MSPCVIILFYNSWLTQHDHTADNDYTSSPVSFSGINNQVDTFSLEFLFHSNRKDI